MRTLTIVLLCTMLSAFAEAQDRGDFSIKWSEEYFTFSENGQEYRSPQCFSCEQIAQNGYAPYYLGKLTLGKDISVNSVALSNIIYTDRNVEGVSLSTHFPSEAVNGLEWVVKEERGQQVLLFTFPAALKNGSNAVQLISRFKLNIDQNRISNRSRSHNFVSNSV